MKIIKNWLIEAFAFSKTEINGTWLLLMVIIFLAVIPRVYFNYHQQSASTQDKGEIKKWANEIASAIEIKEFNKPKWVKKSTKSSYSEGDHSDTKKKYIKAEPEKALFDNTKTSFIKADYSKSKRVPEFSSENKLNLNTASAEQLQKINGIGPVLSERIIKFRNALGGFSSADQLNEVYGLKLEMIDKLSKITLYDSSFIKININSDSLKYLMHHPYIDYKLARSIINYRKVHHQYKNPEELMDLKLMTDSIYQKLYPYISISH